ncbi:type II toxin-antitoxin system death-on-curing family toxin [Roseibacillus persicicus]|uniref:type II toxin-antitoxin system death-on-curing family toxin n=1 Tax=Roseibacillus persicicus TaxID=454148 RepID=UPI00398A866D
MSSFVHPTKLQVLRIYGAVLAKDGGADGIQDEGLLESALAAPQASFGGAPIITDVVEVAAAYLFYLCSNHPFVDGNKRVAFATALVFLRLNNIDTKPDGPEWEALVLDVAASRIDKSTLITRLRDLLS